MRSDRFWSVAVSGNTAFAGTRRGTLAAVDLAAGKVLWTNADGRGEVFSTPAVDGRFVVFGATDGVIRAVRRDGGAAAWAFDRTEASAASSWACSAATSWS